MKNKTGRRAFIKSLGAGSTAALFSPGAILSDQTTSEDGQIIDQTKSAGKKPSRQYNGSYTGEFLNRIAFPIGGLGAGMFCLEGTGALSHVSIRNRPDIFNEPGMFAAVSVKGIKNGAKLLEGPVPDWKKFGQREAGNGLGGATTGLPHFHHAVFTTRFPFAHIDLSDTDLPLESKAYRLESFHTNR